MVFSRWLSHSLLRLLWVRGGDGWHFRQVEKENMLISNTGSQSFSYEWRFIKTFEIVNVLFLLSEAEVRSPSENKCLCNLCSQLVSNLCKVVQFRERLHDTPNSHVICRILWKTGWNTIGKFGVYLFIQYRYILVYGNCDWVWHISIMVSFLFNDYTGVLECGWTVQLTLHNVNAGWEHKLESRLHLRFSLGERTFAQNSK